MTGVVQWRRSNTAGILAATPVAGEIWVGTDWYKPVVGDGATAGGIFVDGHRRNAQTGTTYTVLISDVGKIVTLSNASAVAVTLPQAGTSFIPAQGAFWVLNLGAGAVTITPTTSTINGAATLVLAQYDGARIVSDGTNYVAVLCANPAAALPTLLAGVANRDVLVYNNGTAKWENERPKYVIGVAAPGTTPHTASQVIALHRFAVAVTIPANFGAYLGLTSQAGGMVNADSSTEYSVEKAASASPLSFSQVGTVTFGAGGVVPTFASAGGSAITFAVGDVLRVVAPATPDDDFAGFYATIVGYET